MAGVFDLAMATRRAERDPVYPVRRALPPNKTQHKRALEVDEIGQLLRDMAGHGGRHEILAAFRLMWLTLCRPREAVEARWSEFDLDAALWRIPAERTKQRKPLVVPPPRQAVKLLRALQGVTGRWEHVFPGRDNHKQPMAMALFRQALHGHGWSGKYSPHATRTTGSTRLNEMGYRPDWIERQLAHQEPSAVRRTYNHAEHFADRVVMMQRWADLLDQWEKAASGGHLPRSPPSNPRPAKTRPELRLRQQARSQMTVSCMNALAKIGPPMWLLAEVTYRCPLHFVFCYNPANFAKHETELSTDDWLRVLREGRELGAVQCGFSCGARRIGFSNGMFPAPPGRARLLRGDLLGRFGGVLGWPAAPCAAAAPQPDLKIAWTSSKPARFANRHRARPESSAAPPRSRGPGRDHAAC